jgi:cytochrome c oxidase subunit II
MRNVNRQAQAQTQAQAQDKDKDKNSARPPGRRRLVHRGVLVLPVLSAVALAGLVRDALAAPQPETGWGLPRDVSLHGWRVDWLMNTTTVFVAILFLATIVWILWASIAHGPRHRADYDQGNAKAQIVKAGCLSAVIFGVVDGNLLINGLSDLNHAFWNIDAADAQPGAVRIQINAHQWAWDARYAGPDGKFNTQDDIVTLNDIRVPVDTPVILQLAATDVLHSFSLPNFRIKQDAVPGMVNRLWFQAKETGAFEIACAQHCGVSHYKMRGQLTVLSKEAYELWAREASEVSSRSFDPEDKGAQWGWEWAKASK